MTATTERYRHLDVPIDSLHELAAIDRKLRESSLENPNVTVGRNGARISFDTGRGAEHHRGSITASVCTAIADTDAWKLVQVHDPLRVDDGLTNSMLTLIREGDDE